MNLEEYKKEIRNYLININGYSNSMANYELDKYEASIEYGYKHSWKITTIVAGIESKLL